MTNGQNETMKDTSYGEMVYNKLYSTWRRLGYSREYVVTLLNWVAERYSNPKDRSNFVYRNIISGEISKDTCFSEFNTFEGSGTFAEDSVIDDREHWNGENDERLANVELVKDAINAVGLRLGYKDAFKTYLHNNYSFRFMYGYDRKRYQRFRDVMLEELQKRFKDGSKIFEAIPNNLQACSFSRLCESICTRIVNSVKKTQRTRERVLISLYTTNVIPAIDWLVNNGYLERQGEYLKVLKRYRAPRNEYKFESVESTENEEKGK